MATTYAHASVTVQNLKDGGTIAQAGNIVTAETSTKAANPITNKVALMDMNAADDSVAENLGSRVLVNDGTAGLTDANNMVQDAHGIKKAVSGGTLAYNASATEWVMHGNNVTSTLSGAANTVLSPAGRAASTGDRGTENIKIIDRQLGDNTTEIDVLAEPSTQLHPERTKASDAGTRITFWNPNDNGSAGSVAVVSEIESTRAIPGALTYMQGGKLAKNDDYKARDSAES
jgi:hypothetical protein